MSVNKLIVLCCLILPLHACYRQPGSQEQVSSADIQTLVFAYQTPQQRQELEAWFKSKGLMLETQMAGANKAEYAVSLNDSQYQLLQTQWAAIYRFERRDQRLIVICCHP